jgi:hypothetical protein
MALIWTLISGGKNPGPTGALMFFESRQAVVKEALTPLTHDVPANGERSSDLVIGESLGGEQDHLGPKDLKVWQRILSGTTFQNLALILRETYRKRAVSWHCGDPPFSAG